MLNKIKYIANSLAEFIFPWHCVICDEKLNSSIDEIICKKCLYSLPTAPSREAIVNDLIKNIGRDELSITNAISLFSSEKESTMKLVYNLKYHGVRKIGYKLGVMLGDLIAKEAMPKYDVVVPVPIHKAKYRERGYNQSDFIARGVAERLKVAFNPTFAKRHKYTISQTLMDGAQRRSNVKNIFTLTKNSDANGKTILLVDDVLTTGSTLNSLADMLMYAGANQVDVATLLRA